MVEADSRTSRAVTTPSVIPGFHSCTLSVDGVQVNDPASDTFFATASLGEGISKHAESLPNALQQVGSKNAVSRDAKGLAHEWQAWRYARHDFALRLFQQKK